MNTAAPLRVIVTRPEPQASAWAATLVANGVGAVVLPLIEIAPPRDAQAVAAAWHGLRSRRLAVFVSPSAVQMFFAARPAHAHWPDPLVAGSTGPGTSRALRELGVAAASIVEPPVDAGQFDSEALWSELRQHAGWDGADVLVVRGDGGREWLAETLRAEGARVDTLSAYTRLAPAFGADARSLLHAAATEPRRHLWLFASSQGIDNLDRAAPGRDWRAARAIATHPRITARARKLGFVDVTETRPTLEAVLRCIQSMRP